MKIVAVVPVKLNNKRLPGKNIRQLSTGVPLCKHIFETLMHVDGIDEKYVYCSDEHIQQYMPNGMQYLKRSTELDKDSTSMNQVLRAFAQDVDADVYVMTHTTAPFLSSQSIEKGMDRVVNQDYDSAFSVKKLQDFLWKDGKPLNYTLDNIPRTQDLPVIYEETSGFYIYRKEVIQRLNRRIGERAYLVEVNGIEAIDIDEEDDFYIADAISYFQNRRKEYE